MIPTIEITPVHVRNLDGASQCMRFYGNREATLKAIEDIFADEKRECDFKYPEDLVSGHVG